ncbi:MAG TPA: YceI family protein [Acidobacteriaceae bacterium]|nr:YceI family protein [Acidobacteriaceae bacterium]
MRPSILRKWLVPAFAALFSHGGLAASAPEKEITLHLDPAKTEIRFTLSDVLHTVHGTFAMKSGTIAYDPATGHAEGQVVVELDSGNSGSPTRDRLMKENILETATYPEAIFRPQTVSAAPQPGADQQITVDGVFTIHGKDHPLRLVMRVRMSSPDRLTATTEFGVPYVAWGMKDPSTFVLRVEKQVTIDVTAEGTADSSSVTP